MPLEELRFVPDDLRSWNQYLRSVALTLEAASVGAVELQDSGVTEDKVAANAISTDKILAEAVTTAKIDDGAVTTAKITDGSVTYAKIQDVSDTDKILGRSTAGPGDVEEIDCTLAGRELLDDATAADQRTTLGLGTAATEDIGTSGATVPLLNGTNVHASGQFTAFGVGTTATQQAANADTSGATLGQLETEVNELKAVLRAFGLIAT